MIEVLMAILIFTVGLIGLGAMMVTATKANQTAYVRTQVTFLANSMADRMRANPWGLWNGSYDDDNYPLTGTPAACDAATGCKPADIADRDKKLWSQQLRDSLPAVGKTSIKCTKASGFDPSAQYQMRPPYSGSCVMTISWAERGFATGGGDDAVASGSLQSFTWKFEP
ncbi:type IV pilus modification protein PilV [Luteibacter aegosomatissinici]|uniref:type IV pilus modification protein PilV n=1 Tax=Luteibacter aegosomatissinici TaxID=2911539 RepID=UPI001FF75773|nr:type IV pilus modification protein PilV [Luteibacter aegosomatissinici]UPG93368.1 type IV pilus modification protein PilV [Luteibacter aegosomatissinici]